MRRVLPAVRSEIFSIRIIEMLRVKNKNRGLTLIELLVTMMIMGIMIAIAVPVIRPPVDARSVKEAARMVSTALASARTKAIETGQSWGIEFTPLGSRPAGRLARCILCGWCLPIRAAQSDVLGGVWTGPYGDQLGTLKLNYHGQRISMSR